MQAALAAVLADNGSELANALATQSEEPLVNEIVPGTGATLLHIAANRGHLSCIRALTEAGASIEAIDGTGGTALFAAVGGAGPLAIAHHAVVEFLLANNANAYTVDGEGLMPLHEAANNGDYSSLKLLLSAPSNNSDAATEAVNARASTGVGMTPLHFAAAGAAQRPNLYRALQIPVDASAEQVRQQYHRMALLYHPDKLKGDSPTNNGGGSMNPPSNMDTEKAKETFKMITAAYSVLGDELSREAFDHAHERCAELLLAHGADHTLCTTHDNVARSAFDLALHFRQWGVARAIQRHALRGSFPSEADDITTATASNSKIEQTDISARIPRDIRSSRTLLHHVLAAFMPVPWILSLLLKSDGDSESTKYVDMSVVVALFTQADNDKETPFHLACGMGQHEVVASVLALMDERSQADGDGQLVASKLVAHVNSNGEDALIIAVKSEMELVVNALLATDIPIDVQHRDDQGLSALDWANKLIHENAVLLKASHNELGDVARKIASALKRAGAVTSSYAEPASSSLPSGESTADDRDVIAEVDTELLAAFTS